METNPKDQEMLNLVSTTHENKVPKSIQHVWNYGALKIPN